MTKEELTRIESEYDWACDLEHEDEYFAVMESIALRVPDLIARIRELEEAPGAPSQVWLLIDPTDSDPASLAYATRELAEKNLAHHPERDRVVGPYVRVLHEPISKRLRT